LSLFQHGHKEKRKFPTLYLRIMLFFLLIHLINYMNIKFQKYKDVFSQPERIRLKRKTNESDENINVRKISQNFKSKIIADFKNNTSQENITKNKTISGQQQNNKTILRNAANDSGKAEPDHEPVHVIQPHPEIRNVESFSLYLSKDKRIDKGPKQEISSYSQKTSFGQLGTANHVQGRFYSDSGGLFMVTATFHVKTEVMVVPGHKKKQKKKSYKNSKIQLKLQICANGKCKASGEIRNVQSLNNFKKIKTSKNTIGSITLLAGHGMVQTCSCGGLVQVARGEHVSVHVQVTGHVFLLAGSHFSGVMIG